MKLISWNINGIRAVQKKGGLDEIFKQEDPDIICFQEIKANKEQVDIKLSGYHQIWNSAQRKGYSGTAIFSKIEPQETIFNFDQPEFNFEDKYGDANTEGRVIAADFKDFYLVTVYTPNSKGDLTRLKFRHKVWDPAFLNHVNELKKKKPVIFCGDLNVAHQEIDLARPKDNVGKHGFTNEEREGFDNIEDSGFFDTFRYINPDATDEYSWWTHWGNARGRNVGWRIDYFLADENLKDRVEDAYIRQDILGSDHAPVGLVLRD